MTEIEELQAINKKLEILIQLMMTGYVKSLEPSIKEMIK